MNNFATVQIKETSDDRQNKLVKYCHWCHEWVDTLCYCRVLFNDGCSEAVACLACVEDNWSLPCGFCNEFSTSQWRTCHAHEILCPVKYQLKKK